MQIHPIFRHKPETTNMTFCGKNHNLLELLHRNYTLNSKNIADKIITNGRLISANGEKAKYNISPAGNPPKIPAAGIIKGLMEIIIDRPKKLITSIKIFSGKQPETLLEETQYTYNKKGQIIRTHKQTFSPNGIQHSIKTNIKYEDNSITMKKEIDEGVKDTTTIITSVNGKKLILKSGKNQNGTIEHFKYEEGKTLYSNTVSKHSDGQFEAFGDPHTGEMVFSRSTINPTNAGEYIELLSNGSYEKQVLSRNGHIAKKEIPPSVADSFIHQKIDLITPQNEILTKLEEYGL